METQRIWDGVKCIVSSNCRFKDSAHDAAMMPLIWLRRDGTVYYVPRQTYQTPCTFDMDKFPYDTQTCHVVLGSWAYLMDELDFDLMDNGTDKEFYVGHSEFVLESLIMTREEAAFGEQAVPFVELKTEIKLARRTTFFYYCYMMPADVLLFLLPLIHLIPPDRESKLILRKNSLLFYCFFYYVIFDILFILVIPVSKMNAKS